MPRDILINEVLGIHINTVYKLLSWSRSVIFFIRGKMSFVHTARKPPLFSHSLYWIHPLFEQYCHFLYHFVLDSLQCISLCHDGAITENICQLRGKSTNLSQVTIKVSSRCVLLFLFFSFSLSLSLSLSLCFTINSLSLWFRWWRHGRGISYIASAQRDIMNRTCCSLFSLSLFLSLSVSLLVIIPVASSASSKVCTYKMLLYFNSQINWLIHLILLCHILDWTEQC